MFLKLFFIVAHSKPVRGVAIDAVNMEVFSGSSDSTIKVQYMMQNIHIVYNDIVSSLNLYGH